MADLADLIESERAANEGRWITLEDGNGNVLGEARVLSLSHFDFKLEVSVLARTMGRAEAMRKAAPMLVREMRGVTIGGKEIGADPEMIRQAVEGSSAVYMSILTQQADAEPGE